MNKRIVIDPVTRIEGHLRIEAEVDADQTIIRAYSSGTMVRGIETILKGRDPRMPRGKRLPFRDAGPYWDWATSSGATKGWESTLSGRWKRNWGKR